MSNFLEDMAFRQFENKLPERDNRKIAFYCNCCDEPIYEGDTCIYVDFMDCHYCNMCAEKCIAEREDF